VQLGDGIQKAAVHGQNLAETCVPTAFASLLLTSVTHHRRHHPA